MPSNEHTATWLVTGTSRGLGLEFVKELLKSPNNLVIAACRSPEKAPALTALLPAHHGMLHILKLDVSDFDAVRAAQKDIAAILADRGLDYLLNNAGILLTWDKPLNMSPENLLATVRTNAVAPVLLAQVCLPFLEKGRRKAILNISSTEGSIETAGVDRKSVLASYGSSKTMLNMLMYKMSVERPDLIVVCLCPGWVKTDLGGDGAEIDASESIPALIKMAESFTHADSGRFIRYNGESIPW
ncbi:NAD-P-binding protein [Trametes gibbosa]|nr:NAD-P-binding protein [Trametes gibbosa]